MKYEIVWEYTVERRVVVDLPFDDEGEALEYVLNAAGSEEENDWWKRAEVYDDDIQVYVRKLRNV